MHNISICDNAIVNCKTAAIGVQYCKHARVENNKIENPMAAGLQTSYGKIRNYENSSAIFCNSVADVTISGNRITLVDPQLIPQVHFLYLGPRHGTVLKLLEMDHHGRLYSPLPVFSSSSSASTAM
jgi:hypothetical protein